MSMNQTPSRLFRLPEGMRVLSHEDMRAVHGAVREAARQHRVNGASADDITYTVLAVAGCFVQPPEPDPDTCTALFLPHQREQVTPELLGVWQQCTDDVAHDPADGHNNEAFSWRDGEMGAVPRTLEA